ncbi:MAG: NAD(P)H-hydrate dehydratase [Patescibacteria group bacterium]
MGWRKGAPQGAFFVYARYLSLFPVREYNASMKSKGRVLVVGGSKEYAGAPYLAGMAALRSGAESVIVMAPEKVAWALNALSPDLMTRKLPGRYLSRAHRAAILKQLKTADVLVLGNGAGVRPGTAALMLSLMRWPGLKVIDADAVKVLRGSGIENAILTPNEGEWATLVKQSDVRALLKKNVIVRKGARTRVLGNRISFAIKAHPGLRKAGTGDVLAGLIAGFLARGLSPFAAAKTACERGNRLAAALAKRARGYDYLASDLVNELKKTSDEGKE